MELLSKDLFEGHQLLFRVCQYYRVFTGLLYCCYLQRPNCGIKCGDQQPDYVDPDGWCRHVSFSPKADRIIVAEDCFFSLWDLAQGVNIHTIPSGAFSPDGNSIVYVAGDGHVDMTVWSVRSGARHVEADVRRACFSARFIADG